MVGPNELVSDWMQADQLRPYLEIGDLVEFRRVAGFVKRRIYTHWGVFIGFENDKAYIVHAGTDTGDFGGSPNNTAESLAILKTKMAQSCQVQIRRDELNNIARGDSCRINNSLDRERRPFPPATVVDRALLMLGKVHYNILLNNCEHFANYCRYGLKRSNQAALAKTIILTSATLCLTGSLITAVVVAALSYTFTHIGQGINTHSAPYPK